MYFPLLECRSSYAKNAFKKSQITLTSTVLLWIIKNILIIFCFVTDWDKENITEPPPTKHISIDDLNKIATGEKNLTCFIPKVMSHSISNERCVQATAKKVLVRRGYEKVHAALLQTNKSIASAPYKFQKSHFLRPQLNAHRSKE